MAKILVIDDDAALRRTIDRILRRAGHAVTLAEDGREGMQQFDTDRPDLVISDIIMDVQEGMETIRTLRRHDASILILAISGGALRSPFYLDMATRLGADAALLKPFDPETLMGEVEKLLARPHESNVE